MGPYYIATLVTLLGPVGSVVARGQIGHAERIVTTPGSKQLGQTIKVETLTTVQALLEFEGGAQVTFLASWDVWQHGMLPLEIHGTRGSMRVPDPNWFSGPIELAVERGGWTAVDSSDRTFGRANWPKEQPVQANYRGLGVAEMARAIAEGRPSRCNGDIALHVLEIMDAMLCSAQGQPVAPFSQCERPEGLTEEAAASLLSNQRDL